jgi:hypothetical protein
MAGNPEQTEDFRGALLQRCSTDVRRIGSN